MPINYDITRLADGKYKASRLSTSGKTTVVPVSFGRSDLEIYLKDSVSEAPLKQALRTLDSTGRVTVEADLER